MEAAVENGKNETGWSPLRGSYEEAVLSWYEQIDISFRRRSLEAKRTGQELRKLREPRAYAIEAEAD